MVEKVKGKVRGKTKEENAEETVGGSGKVMEFYEPNYMTSMLSGYCVPPVENDNGCSKCAKSPSGSHWWDISAPGQPSSDGRCRYCGERRVFWNTVEAALKAGEMVIRKVKYGIEKKEVEG